MRIFLYSWVINTVCDHFQYAGLFEFLGFFGLDVSTFVGIFDCVGLCCVCRIILHLWCEGLIWVCEISSLMWDYV